MTDDGLPIVDAHHHLWDLEGPIRYPWLVTGDHGFLGDYSRICRSYLPPEYRRDTALHNVVATVHIEAECDRSQQLAETEWVTRMNAEHGMPNAIVAHVWVDTPDSEEILAGHKRFPLVRGIRTKPVIASGPNDSVRGQPRSLQDPKWRKGLALLEQYDLSWDLRVPWYHLEEAAEVCREYPAMRIVLNHTGYPLDRSPEQVAVWRKGMEALAACPNVHCKISGFTVKGKPWTLAMHGGIIMDTISMFGVDRCMFASNHPVDGVKASWDWIFCQFKAVTADMPDTARRKLFADNALAFYRISSTSSSVIPAANTARRSDSDKATQP